MRLIISLCVVGLILYYIPWHIMLTFCAGAYFGGWFFPDYD